MFDLGFLKDVHHELDFKEAAKTKPLRFMVFETYIIGGIGTYVTGEVLSGIMRPETVLVSAPGNFDCEVRASHFRSPSSTKTGNL